MTSVQFIGEIPSSRYREFGLGKELLNEMLRKMVEIRLFEEKVEELFLVKGLLAGPSHLYLGQEAVAVGALFAIEKTDPVVTTYRCHGYPIVRGESMRKIMSELFGKSGGNCKGIGGSMHAGITVEKGVIYSTAIVGSGVPIAAGIALGQQYNNSDRVVLCFFGDGAVNTGAFHEGVNIAALWKLPVVFICENNLYAMSTRIEKSVAGPGIADKAPSYGMSAIVADGNDVLATFLATKNAADRARRGLGPTLVECRTYKSEGHGVYDKAEYRPREEVEAWKKRDPIELFANKLQQLQLISKDEIALIYDETKKRVEDAVEVAISESVLPFEELHKLVYA